MLPLMLTDGFVPFSASGGVFDGQGFTVVDNYSCGDVPCGGYTVGPAAEAAPTTTLSPGFEPFLHSGSVHDGLGYTVEDTMNCGSGSCGGWTVGQGGPQEAVTHTTGLTEGFVPFTTSGGVFDGNGFTVVDDYSCGDTPCGGFTVGPSAEAATTTTLSPGFVPFTHSGGVHDGLGYTVVDTMNCGSSDCGGWTIGQGGPSEAEATPVVALTPTPTGQTDVKPCRPGVAAYLACGHALALAAAAATYSAGEKLLSGEVVSSEQWDKEFKDTASEAAKASNPVAGYIMTHHLLTPRA